MREVGNERRQHLDDVRDRRIQRQHVIDAAVEWLPLQHEDHRAHRVGEIEVGTKLVRRGPPDFEWLPGDGAPAELVDGRVKPHADRRTEDRAHPEDHKPQAVAPAELIVIRSSDCSFQPA